MRRNQKRGLSYTTVALLTIALVVIGTYLAFTKRNPVRASTSRSRRRCRTPTSSRPGTSVVRIAGVNVGKVTKVEHVGEGEPAARVTMELDDSARPIHKDATLKIRPRIFFEGNFFVDLQPGLAVGARAGRRRHDPDQQHGRAGAVRPGARRAAVRHAQGPQDRCSSELNKGYSNGGAEAINRTTTYWEPAYKNSAIVNDATLGILEHDLSGYLDKRRQASPRRSTATRSQLKSLITDLRRTGGAFAAERRRAVGGDRRAAAHAARRHAGAARAQRRAAVAAPLHRRAAARACARRARRSTRRSRSCASCAASCSRASCAACPPTCARPSPRSRSSTRRRSRCSSRCARSSSCQNEVVLPWTLDKIEDPTSRRSAPSTRSSPSRSSASRARAARSTPTASSSASRSTRRSSRRRSAPTRSC